MAAAHQPVRQRVTLPGPLAQQVRHLARTENLSMSRAMVKLIEADLEARANERRRYLDLLERLRRTRNPREQGRLTEELARMTFGS